MIVNPLPPADTWDYFCLDRISYHGHLPTILYDRDGTKYGRGSGMSILADGREIGHAPELRRLEATLPE